jgi:hypothetical protein
MTTMTIDPRQDALTGLRIRTVKTRTNPQLRSIAPQSLEPSVMVCR